MELALQPIDYSIAGTDLGQSLLKGYQGAEADKLARAQLARQLQQQQQLDTARATALKDPTARNLSALFILDPGSHEAIKAAHGALSEDQQKVEINDLSAMLGYARAGRKNDVKRLIQRRIDADTKAGKPTAEDEQFLEMIDDEDDGEDVVGLISMQLAGRLGPERFSEAFERFGNAERADTKLPAEVGLLVGQTAQANAGALKAIEEAEQIAPNAQSGREVDQAKIRDYNSAIQWRADSLNLERDRLETNTNLELEKLAQARELAGVQLSPTSEKAMTDSVLAAESSRQLANRANGLADRMAALGTGGTASQITEVIKGSFGNPTLLRKEYTALINSQAVKNLPPGPASDRDIQLALKGFPVATAGAETMASFLRGMAKMQDIAANREQARADWISENGNLGTAKRDLTVNGVRVPKGATFGDFSKSQSSIERREALPERPYLRHGR